MADVMSAWLRGQKAAQAEQQHEQEMEHSKLRQQILKHGIEGLKIEDQIRARTLREENARMMQGQPAADLPSEPVTTQEPNLPSQSNAGVQNLPDVVSNMVRQRMGVGSVPGGVRSFEPAPLAQSVDPGTHPETTMRPSMMDIPGVEGLGVPGIKIRPQSAEEIVRRAIAAREAEGVTLNPGQTRTVGGKVVARGDTKHLILPADATAFDPDNPTEPIAKGAPKRFAPPRPPARDTSAAALTQDQRAWDRDFREYADAKRTAAKAHEQAVKAVTAANVNLGSKAQLPVPPAFTFPEFGAWRQEKKGKAGTPNGSASSGGQFPVTWQGQTYNFPSAENAATFKKKKGLQ